MAIGGDYVLNRGFIANEAIGQFLFVTLVAAEDRAVDLADAQGERVLGVCQEEITADDATAGRVANIALLGVSVVVAGAAITKGNLVTAGADARAEVAAAGDVVAGVALDDGVDGDWIGVLLTPGGGVVV
jgi:hypothetical protein